MSQPNPFLHKRFFRYDPLSGASANLVGAILYFKKKYNGNFLEALNHEQDEVPDPLIGYFVDFMIAYYIGYRTYKFDEIVKDLIPYSSELYSLPENELQEIVSFSQLMRRRLSLAYE